MRRFQFGGCVLGLLALLHTVVADCAEPSAGAAMAPLANRFLETLTPEQRALAAREYDDPARLDWHNIPKPTRKGLQLKDMSAEQRQFCEDLLRASLSESGFVAAQRIMALENNLREGERKLANGPLRDPERYFLTIFGTPGPKGRWGWSFEGHHLSLNFAIEDGKVISSTPSFWGANPATVNVVIEGGPQKGIRTLANEEQLAFDLVNSLNDAQKAKAILAAKAPADYRAAGQPRASQDPAEGLAVAEMTADQRKTLEALVRAYAAHWNAELADKELAAIEKAGWESIRFAWLGSTEPGVGHSYRVQGPSFVLELVNVQSGIEGNIANHIHSVWRDPRGDFGVVAPN